MKTVSRMALGLASLMLLACGHPAKEASRYTLTFATVDDLGEPLARVPIQVGETAIGRTGESGVLRAEVNAKDGDRYPLVAPCPDGYLQMEVPDEVVFLDTRGLGGEKNASLEIQIVCTRKTRVAAVLVHTGGYEGMPILVDGIAKGTTGPGGYAHLRLEGVSSSQFEISLDTSGEPNLLPKNPRHQLQLGGEDGLFVFEPAFSKAEELPKKPKRRRRRRSSSEEAETGKPKRPVKID